MFDAFSDTSADMPIEAEPVAAAYRWNKRALLLGGLALSAAILVLGALAIALLGVPIALITGMVEGDRQAAARTLAEIWRLSPLLLAAEFVLGWLLVALFFVVRRVLAKFGVAIT